MPQSSLLSWLSGTSDKSVQPPSVRQATEHPGQDALRKPPSSSPESIQATSNTVKTEKSLNTNHNKSGTKRSLPPNVSFRPCTKTDIPDLKKLNSLLLPIPYRETFYRETHEDPKTNNLTLLAFWHDQIPSTKPGRLIGAIRCCIFDVPTSHVQNAREGPLLYLSTLALLSPYRSHGIATHMLETVTKRAVNEYGATSVGAHVWEANTEALEWYRKRGFVELSRDAAYYRRLQPAGAVVVQKRVSVLDLVGD